MSSNIYLARDYPHSRTKVWTTLTDPILMALWGMRPDGFAPIVGTHFRLIGEPNRMWRGFIECKVIEVRAPEMIAYSWIGNTGDAPSQLAYTLAEISQGTRLSVAHTGFSGIGGFLFARLVMKPGLKKTLDHELPRVFANLMEDGTVRPDSTLTPKF